MYEEAGGPPDAGASPDLVVIGMLGGTACHPADCLPAFGGHEPHEGTSGPLIWERHMQHSSHGHPGGISESMASPSSSLKEQVSPGQGRRSEGLGSHGGGYIPRTQGPGPGGLEVHRLHLGIPRPALPPVSLPVVIWTPARHAPPQGCHCAAKAELGCRARRKRETRRDGDFSGCSASWVLSGERCHPSSGRSTRRRGGAGRRDGG